MNYPPRKPNIRFFPILVNRTVIFFFLMCLLVLFLYGVGTIQGFVDSTQLALLFVYVAMGIFLTIASIGGIVIEARRFFKIRKIRYFFRAGGYMFLMIFGSITVLAIMFIISVASGNSDSGK